MDKFANRSAFRKLIKLIDEYVDSEENIYIFDKGYFKYSWYDEMTDKKQKFITRQQSNAVTVNNH